MGVRGWSTEGEDSVRRGVVRGVIYNVRPYNGDSHRHYTVSSTVGPFIGALYFYSTVGRYVHVPLVLGS